MEIVDDIASDIRRGDDCLETTTSQSNTTVQYLLTQLGTTGLAGWTPAIIAISVGMLFLGAFMVRGGNSRL